VSTWTIEVVTREAWLARIAKHERRCRKCKRRVVYNAGTTTHPLPPICLRYIGMLWGLRACELARVA